MRLTIVLAMSLALCLVSRVMFAQLDADDVDGLTLKPLSPTSVRLSWNATASTPCFKALTYSVFRDTDENFDPSLRNRIASKLAVTHYVAQEPGKGQTYYYLVRAERLSENCTQIVSRKSPPLPDSSEQNAAIRLEAVEKRLSDMDSKMAYYKYLIDQKQVKTDTIDLDPSVRTFQRLDSDSGSFLISVDDVSPYLNGYRLKLNIGNPSSAKFASATIKIRWGKAYDFSRFTTETYTAWQKSIHEKSVTLTSDLAPGNWNHENVDLIPAEPNELGYLEMSIATPTVILTTKD